MKRVRSLIIVLGFALVGPSLADVARKEAERRKAVTEPVKTYTNKDVEKASPKAPYSVVDARPEGAKADAQAPPAAGEAGGAAAQPGTVPAAGAQEPAKDEAYWRKRMTEAREQLQRSKLFAEALQSRINALTTDFVNRDDPYQRAQIAQQRQEALAELDRVTRDIDNYSKAVDDLQEEARRAGVPPGWVR
jgi:hypothetical protein